MFRHLPSRLDGRVSLAWILGAIGWLTWTAPPAQAVPVPAPYKMINNQGTTDPNIAVTVEVVDAMSAKAVITFKGDYAKQAAQLALPNPWVLQGTGDGNKHVFRDAQLNKLIKTISELFSDGKKQATVHDAALHAVKTDEQWDVTLSVGLDGTLKVWETERGRLLLEMGRQDEWFTRVAISPNGRAVVTAGSVVTSADDGSSVTLWHAVLSELILIRDFFPEGRSWFPFALGSDSQAGPVSSLAFSPDGTPSSR